MLLISIVSIFGSLQRIVNTTRPRTLLLLSIQADQKIDHEAHEETKLQDLIHDNDETHDQYDDESQDKFLIPSNELINYEKKLENE